MDNDSEQCENERKIFGKPFEAKNIENGPIKTKETN
jgi:hypothetical protein